MSRTPRQLDGAAAAVGSLPSGAEHPAEARGLTANIAALATSQAITWSLTLLWTIVVPRHLGAADMGILVTATSVASILGLMLGLPARDYLCRETAAAPLRGAAYAGSAVVFKFALAPLYLGAVGAYIMFFQPGPVTSTVVLLVAAATVVSALTEPALAAFQALQRMEYLAYYEVLTKALVSLGGVALALLGAGVLGLSGFGLAMVVLTAAMAARWIRRLVGLDLRPRLGEIAHIVRSSLPYWTFGVFFMIYLWADAVMLGVMTPPEVVGWYGVASRIFTTLMFVPVIIATATLPRLVQAHQQGWPALMRAARPVVETVVVLALPVTVVTVATAREVIPLLFGATFTSGGPVLAVLGACIPFMYANIVLNQVFVAAGRPIVWMWLLLGATVVNPALNYFLIRWSQDEAGNGAIGAAASMVITEILIVVAGFALLGRRILARRSWWRLLRAAVAAAVMYLAMVQGAVLGLAGAVAAGLVTFIAVALLLRVVSASELRSLKRQMTVLGRRGRPEPVAEPSSNGWSQ